MQLTMSGTEQRRRHRRRLRSVGEMENANIITNLRHYDIGHVATDKQQLQRHLQAKRFHSAHVNVMTDINGYG